MRAAAFNNSAVSGKLYDPAANWTTVRYGWKAGASDPFLTGTWDAPEKQLQWWFGKRPLQTRVVQVNSNTSPSNATFYKTRDTLQPAIDGWEDYDGGIFQGMDVTCKERTADQADARLGTVYFKAAPGTCAGKVWIPEVIDVSGNTWAQGTAPLGSQAKRNTYTDVEYVFGYRTACKTWEQGSSAADNNAAFNLLRSMLLPGGTDITWNYTGPCVHQMPNRDDVWGAWRAFQGPSDAGLGPNAVYRDGKYPGPGPDMRHWDVTDLQRFLTEFDYNRMGDAQAVGNPDFVGYDYWGPPNFRDDVNPMSMQQVRLGWFDAAMSPAESQWFFMWGDGDGLDGNNVPVFNTTTGPYIDPSNGLDANPLWFMSAWCPHTGTAPGSGWEYGATCTLSVTPMQADVFAQDLGCAGSLPQGIPFITCRAPNGTLLSINPATGSSFRATSGDRNTANTPGTPSGQPSNRATIDIVAGVNFMLTRQDYSDSDDYSPDRVTLGTQVSC